MPTDDVYPCPHCHGTGEVRHYGLEEFNEQLRDLAADRRERGRRRTVAQVMLARRDCGGCCDRHCDNMACDCLEVARRYEAGLDPLTRYDLTRDNGCSICRDPNCSDPNGKH